VKVVYGVHGYGRGHATRAMAVLPELVRRHEVRILAGGDAYRALAHNYDVLRLPTLRYYHSRPGKRSAYLTLKRAFPAAVDLLWRGPILGMVIEVLEEFRPDVVLCDSEPWTHRAARAIGIPRVSFDHFGVLVYCRWPMAWWQRPMNWLESLTYRALMVSPERVIVASFHRPPIRREGVRVIGPVLRAAVRETPASDGDHLLVYFSSGEKYFRPAVETALREVGCPVTVYGTNRVGQEENLMFRPIANRPFVHDLASCRAVVSTAGNQLISEAVHFGKPMLLMPEDSLEQRLNAATVERLGLGMRTSLRGFSADVLRRFLAGLPGFAGSVRRHAAQDSDEPVDAIERCFAELADHAGE